MKNTFDDIINRHRESPCIVIGHGTSLNDQVSKLKSCKENGVVLIDCNDWYNFHSVTPDYIMYANTIETIRRNWVKLNKYNSFVVYADSVDLTNREWIEENLNCDYLPYDQRHFNGNKCGCGKCCGHIVDGRLTIQEELQKYTGYKEHYGTGDTITIHMIAFAVLLGCNPIYVTGFDLDYQKGYAKSNAKLKVPSLSEIDPYMDRILRDINILDESAKAVNVRIINLNKKSFNKKFETGEIDENLWSDTR